MGTEQNDFSTITLVIVLCSRRALRPVDRLYDGNEDMALHGKRSLYG